MAEKDSLLGPENPRCSVPVHTLEPGEGKEGHRPEIALVLFWQLCLREQKLGASGHTLLPLLPLAALEATRHWHLGHLQY